VKNPAIRVKSVVSANASGSEPRGAYENRIFMKFLEIVGGGSVISQRKLASDLGIALGLVNLYIKRCVSKGLIKVEQVPSRRYAYYLTPKGFAEKSKLAQDYLTWSLTFFRSARSDCADVMAEVRRRGSKTVGLAGAGDLAEIVMLCAVEKQVCVSAIVDNTRYGIEILGVLVATDWDGAQRSIDCWIVVDLECAQATYDNLVKKCGHDRVLVPKFLSVHLQVEDAKK
jgi:DNA-binding MarR family transcriptional regulator